MGRKRKEPLVLEKVRILEMAAEGKCIAKENGMVIFVGGVAPGDVVDLQLTQQKKNYAEARVLRFESLSADRVKPFCSHFGICGGCKWQHIPYEMQLFYKQKQVSDHFERIGKLNFPPIKPILGSAHERYYRNKLEFTFCNKRWFTQEEMTEEVRDANGLGFHVPQKFDRVVDLKECFLQPEPSEKIRAALRDFTLEQKIAYYDSRIHDGQLRNVVVRTSTTGEVMVIVIFKYLNEEVPLVMEFLQKNFPEITSLQYVINAKKNDIWADQEVHHWSGQAFITEKMENLSFRVGPKSFYQTNSLQALELYKVTRNFANLTGQEVVYDLYTGTGTIACFVAAQAREVIGIEYVEMAIEDAKLNATLNGIANARFYAGDMKDILNEDFMNAHPRPDVIITDPPRAGMHEDVLKMLLRLQPQKIVYVSCNPATQARDLAILCEAYEIAEVQPVDMFPHTHHVENVALLIRK